MLCYSVNSSAVNTPQQRRHSQSTSESGSRSSSRLQIAVPFGQSLIKGGPDRQQNAQHLCSRIFSKALAFCFLLLLAIACISFVVIHHQQTSTNETTPNRSNPVDSSDQLNHHHHDNHHQIEDDHYYTHDWVIDVPGGREVAAKLADNHGLRLIGSVGQLKNVFHMRKITHESSNSDASYQHFENDLRNKQIEYQHETKAKLLEDERVVSAEQQVARIFSKRGIIPQWNAVSSRSSIDRGSIELVSDEDHQQQIIVVEESRNRVREQEVSFNDPLWSKQWYMNRYSDEFDLNIVPVWEMGFRGEGTHVNILDDGFEYDNPDINESYDPSFSYDFNSNDSDPFPVNLVGRHNTHGTKCAGVIFMKPNNGMCGVGVAHAGKYGGIRILDGGVTDKMEYDAMTYRNEDIDVYSCSWGPSDNGKTFGKPGTLALKAIVEGIEKGRHGKGSIYSWAAGNGGGDSDNCNCDGYASSIYTIAVNAVNSYGQVPWYAEQCPAVMISAYSGRYAGEGAIATTDISDECTASFSGTSAAAPLATGIFALLIQANRELMWRDVQHILAWTGDPRLMKDHANWIENKAGFRHHTRFGFGLINAEAMIKLAKKWVNVDEQLICSTNATASLPMVFTDKEPFATTIDTSNCLNTATASASSKSTKVNYLEHVVLEITFQYAHRGSTEIFLTSPQGTKVQMLTRRPSDSSTKYIVDFPLMSVATWGENPIGKWKVEVSDRTNPFSPRKGDLHRLRLILYGTEEMPSQMKEQGMRQYDFPILKDGAISTEPSKFANAHAILGAVWSALEDAKGKIFGWI